MRVKRGQDRDTWRDLPNERTWALNVAISAIDDRYPGEITRTTGPVRGRTPRQRDPLDPRCARGGGERQAGGQRFLPGLGYRISTLALLTQSAPLIIQFEILSVPLVEILILMLNPVPNGFGCLFYFAFPPAFFSVARSGERSGVNESSNGFHSVPRTRQCRFRRKLIRPHFRSRVGRASAPPVSDNIVSI